VKSVDLVGAFFITIKVIPGGQDPVFDFGGKSGVKMPVLYYGFPFPRE